MATPEIPLLESSKSSGLPESGSIAPIWHTVLVLVMLLGIAGLSAWKGSVSPAGGVSQNARLLNYGTVMAWEWLTVGLIAWGVRLRGKSIADLIGGRWPNAAAVFRDVRIGVLFLLASDLILAIIQFALKNSPNQALRDLLPQTPIETAVWFALTATAGFCEEVIFRGYLQQQLSRMTRNATAGLVLQAVVFGLCHGYQGAKSVITIAIYGAMFGWLAQRQRSLRPGMITHFLQDGVGGLIAREALKRLPGGLH
jgi:membrane protease YdiL (CAAX protease family)